MVVTTKSILPVSSIFSTCTRQPMALKMVLMIRRYRSSISILANFLLLYGTSAIKALRHFIASGKLPVSI